MRTKGALGRKPCKDKLISMRLTKADYDRLKQCAKYCNMTLTNLLLIGAHYYFLRQKEIDGRSMDVVIDDEYII